MQSSSIQTLPPCPPRPLLGIFTRSSIANISCSLVLTDRCHENDLTDLNWVHPQDHSSVNTPDHSLSYSLGFTLALNTTIISASKP